MIRRPLRDRKVVGFNIDQIIPRELKIDTSVAVSSDVNTERTLLGLIGSVSVGLDCNWVGMAVVLKTYFPVWQNINLSSSTVSCMT